MTTSLIGLLFWAALYMPTVYTHIIITNVTSNVRVDRKQRLHTRGSYSLL